MPAAPEYITGKDLETGNPIKIEIVKGVIQSVNPLTQAQDDLPFIAPGLVDLQVNGYGGVDFNTFPITTLDFEKTVRLLAAEGVTSFFPTVITNSPQATGDLLSNISQACQSNSLIDQAVGGIHLEGPFISKDDGARGAHDLAHVCAPDWELFLKWQEKAEGKIKIITLSPEWDSAPAFITKCVENDVIVSIGHTSATPAQIDTAVKAGARMSTHLGNAAHLMLPRHPNYIWEQLAQDQLWASAIADGFHLPDSFLKVLFRAKPDNSVLVSDCTQFAGLMAGKHKTHIGGEVVLTREGRLHLASQPELLAGSAQSLLWCVNHVISKKLLPPADTWKKASTMPLSLLSGKPETSFHIGQPANLVQFVQEVNLITVRKTYIAGQSISYKEPLR